MERDHNQTPLRATQTLRKGYSLEDFEIVRQLGQGSYSEVIEATLKSTQEHFALKIVDKHLILRTNQVEAIKQERTLLQRLQHPGIVSLHFTFQDASSLYFGLEICPNGDLFEQLDAQKNIPMQAARLYAAEIVDTLSYLQSHHVVHRDLKPENLLLDGDGRLKLADFGSAKLLQPCTPDAAPAAALKSDLVGTADYSPPEALKGETVGTEADLWALGCLIYQMFVGKPPFRGASEYLTFERISQHDLQVPKEVSPEAADLIQGLLKEDPKARLGSGNADYEAIRRHPFFRGISWENIWSQNGPAFVSRTDAGEDDLSWYLQSLALSQPLKVEYDS